MTDLEIANTVLSRLGQSTISAFGENPGTGLILKANYEQERDALLRSIPWNFARTWAPLAQLESAPINLDILPQSAGPGSIIFTGAWRLPGDCLRVYRFSPRTSHWRIVGKMIYSDAVPASNLGPLLGLQPLGADGTDNQPPPPGVTLGNSVGIEYIRQITDPTQFDSLFVDTFIWKLTKDLAFGVTGLAEVFKMAELEYSKAIAEAGAINGMENWPDEFYNTDLTDVRYGYSGVGILGV